ncbi:DUF4395 family protein [Nonomuraea sp. NPDC049309]|uniref:DUF4395 family protein n=1 Tax=Nonomuraea sp. NPDC049309 TaxID=3364350 RepID=UPI00371B8300
MRAYPRTPRFGAAATLVVPTPVTESRRLLAVRVPDRMLGAFSRRPHAMLGSALAASALKERKDRRTQGSLRLRPEIGPAVAVAGVAGSASGIMPAAPMATAAAFLAAFLIAAFGICLGCAMYLLIRRLLPAANMEVSQ